MLITACGGRDANATDEAVAVRTPVTLTSIAISSITQSVGLNATSSYLRKNQVRANATGYVEKCLVAVGDHVQTGQPLYTIRTKEADALSAVAAHDTSFTIKGSITINAPASGVVTEVNKQLRDYVSDGDVAAVIADENSFVFVVNVPFELNKFASNGTACSILLPDSTIINGTIESKLAAVDPVAQTQGYVVKPSTTTRLPEGLIGIVQLSQRTHGDAQVIIKSAVLSNEEMTRFWVMKLINDTTAVKVPITKGIASDDRIELLTPTFAPTDRIVLGGNYGLADTASVLIAR